MSRVIGIDLGTTNTCAAYVTNKFPRIVPTEGGFSTLPSIVSLQHSGTVLVGQAAKEQQLGNPDRTIGFVKRLLGRQYSSKVVQELQQRLSYSIVPGEGGEAAVSVGGKVYSPTVLQSHILRQLKRYAEIHLGESIPDAVIAVPAFFTDHQRNLVKQAGKLAGFNVRRVINEPTAAALAYGFNRALNQRILIFDLGGGTFDISVLELNHNVFTVSTTGGDTFLGGADFDARIVEWIVDGAKKQLKVDLSSDPKALELLRASAERAKIELSLLANTPIKVAQLQDKRGKSTELELLLDRDTLNGMTRDLVQRTLNVTDRILQAKKLGKQDIHEIILVGGQTRMPLLIDMLTEHFGKGPRKGVHPDECVAMGAALLGDSLGRSDAVTLHDTLSIPIGVASADTLQVVMDRVTLPARAQCELTRKADRLGSVTVDVYQGDRGPLAQAEYLGTLTHGPLPGAGGADVQMGLDFAVDAEGMLTVSAHSNRSSTKQTVTLKTVERAPLAGAPSIPGSAQFAGIIERNVLGDEEEDLPPPEDQPGLKDLVRGWLKR